MRVDSSGPSIAITGIAAEEARDRALARTFRSISLGLSTANTFVAGTPAGVVTGTATIVVGSSELLAGLLRGLLSFGGDGAAPRRMCALGAASIASGLAAMVPGGNFVCGAVAGIQAAALVRG